ncbi:MAG: hypothetical protein ABI288_00495 [Ginsengibacter sp.]
MSLNKIQFSGYLYQNLYNKNLIGATQISNADNSGIKISSLGGNQKKILFLVNNSATKFLDDEEMILLTNLTTACKLSMEDIALVNYSNCDNINYKDLIEYFQSEKILMFGTFLAEIELPFIIPDFQIQSYGGKLFMTAPPLNELITNKDAKKDLWKCLQQIFLN